MGRSFCNGCRFWIWYTNLFGEQFWLCARFDTQELRARKELCSGKYKVQSKKSKKNGKVHRD